MPALGQKLQLEMAEVTAEGDAIYIKRYKLQLEEVLSLVREEVTPGGGAIYIKEH